MCKSVFTFSLVEGGSCYLCLSRFCGCSGFFEMLKGANCSGESIWYTNDLYS